MDKRKLPGEKIMKIWMRIYVIVGAITYLTVMVQAQSATAPNVLEPFETLRGQFKLSILIVLDGDEFISRQAQYNPELSTSSFRAQIEAQLKKTSITILPS